MKYLGLSECTAKDLRRAHAVHPITAIQVEYSPFALYIEDEKLAILKTARELGVTIIAYSPIGRGLLTGQYVRALLLFPICAMSKTQMHSLTSRNLRMTSSPAISGITFPVIPEKISRTFSHS